MINILCNGNYRQYDNFRDFIGMRRIAVITENPVSR